MVAATLKKKALGQKAGTLVLMKDPMCACVDVMRIRKAVSLQHSRSLIGRIYFGGGKAIVNTSNTTVPKIYIGSTETPFKQWLTNHLMSFKDEKYENRMELSKYIWKLKREGETFHISWSILRRASAYSSLSKRCNLCLMENLIILSADKSTLLNKRSELVSKCHHHNKFSLPNFMSAVT